jgi:hypothetical protein
METMSADERLARTLQNWLLVVSFWVCSVLAGAALILAIWDALTTGATVAQFGRAALVPLTLLALLYGMRTLASNIRLSLFLLAVGATGALLGLWLHLAKHPLIF